MRIFCSICKDIFIPYSEVHVTSCGHLYHGACISTWIKQHRSCPQCRTKLSQQPFRVFFDVDKDSEVDPSTLEHLAERLSDKLREAERDKKKLEEENKNFEQIVEEMKECAVSLSKKNETLKTSVKALKEQITKLAKQNEAVIRLENEVESWKNKVSTFQRVDTLIKGTVEEVNNMVESTPVTALAVKQLCTYVGILKAQLHKIESKNVSLIKEYRELTKSVNEDKRKYSAESEELIKNLRASNSRLENELFCLNKAFEEYKKKHPDKTIGSLSSQVGSITQTKKPSFNIDFDMFENEENQSVQIINSIKPQKTVSHWEELVCAGTSRSFSHPLKKSKSLSRTLGNTTTDALSTSFAFDGLGGRKKLRLGGPTPAEEFEKIKKKNKNVDKKSGPSIQNKKIIEYCQIDL